MSSRNRSTAARTYLSSAASESPRRSPAKSSSSATKWDAEDIHRKGVWGYVMASVLIFLVLFLIVRENYAAVHAWARLPAWMSNPLALCLLVLVMFGLAGWATAHASLGTSATYHRVSVGALFLAVGGLTVIGALLVYRSFSFVAAFYVSLLALALALAHFAAVWKVRNFAALADIPLLLGILTCVYYLWYMADESADCLTNCSTVHKVDYTA